jgi:hypothetical protein
MWMLIEHGKNPTTARQMADEPQVILDDSIIERFGITLPWSATAS